MRLALAALFLLGVQLLAQTDGITSALSALQRGDFPAAEQLLHTRLKVRPNDTEALSILSVVLDQEKKYSEADSVYRRALASSPPQPSLLNNFGNHLVATGKLAEARGTFLKVIGLDNTNVNALVQLARLALQNSSANEALAYLNRIPSPSLDRPDAVILKMQANYLLGRQAQGDAILTKLSAAGNATPDQDYALGMALASAHQYEKSEAFFLKTLDAKPSDFDALYNLGLACAHAGDNGKARNFLQQARLQRPGNIDLLYDLAAVEVVLDDKEAALALLAQASQSSLARTDLLQLDVLQLEARTAAALGYFADAAHAWDQYLKLAPADDAARRERAFAETATGEDPAASLAELNAYVRRHPADALGHYELGTAETARDPSHALQELDKSLALKADLTAARVARGLLLYRQGKPQAALADFEFAAQKEPENGAILDRLGETYMALDRTGDALPLLRKAAELRPSDSTVLLHLGRALSKAGQPQEAEVAFARCRELGPNRSSSPHPAGLVEFLSLSPDEQRARYTSGVEHTVQSNPDNVEARVRYLAILLDAGRIEDATADVASLAALKPAAAPLADSIRLLLTASQYSLAKQLLDSTNLSNSPELALDTAIVAAHISGAQAGFDALSRVPEAKRDGDYDLARGLMLELLNRQEEADLYFQRVIKAKPERVDLYLQATLLLIRNNRPTQAMLLLNRGVELRSDDPDLLLLRALTRELRGDHTSADREIRNIEDRWPEWPKVWAAHSLVLNARQQHEQALAVDQVALALGAPPAWMNAPGDLASSVQILFQ